MCFCLCQYLSMSVCLYIYIYIRMCVCVYICTYVCIYMYVCVYSTFSKERVAGDGNQTLGGFRCKLFYTFKEHHHYLICSPAHRKNILEKYNTEMYRRSVQFSHSVISVSLQPHESKHARPPCLSPTPGVYSNSCPSNW